MKRFWSHFRAKDFDWISFTAQGFGSGLIKFAPGTWGTLAGLFIYLFFLQLLNRNLLFFLILGGFLAGCYICAKCSEKLGVHDAPSIVWDEFIGIWFVLFFMPDYLKFNLSIFSQYLSAFLIFRAFDIFKPKPISYFDKQYKNGFGIMIDDLIAAIYSVIALYLLQILMLSYQYKWLIIIVILGVGIFYLWKRFHSKSKVRNDYENKQK